MGVETLLTRLEVTPKGELYAGFRNLGGIYFPECLHVFPSKILGTKKEGKIKNNPGVKSLKEKLEKSKKIYDFNKNYEQKKILEGKKKFKNIRYKDKYWYILQWYGPISLKKELPEEFIKGNYTKESRWLYSNPGNIISLEERLVEILQNKLKIEKELESIKENISKGKRKSNTTRIWNDLDDFFDNYNGKNFEEIKAKSKKIISNLDKRLIEKRKKISDLIIKSNKELNDDIKLVYKKTKKNKREHELRIEKKDFNFLKNARTPNIDEVLNYKWLFMDIEEPLFMNKDSRITWAGIKFVEKGKNISEIYTIHEIGKEKISSYRIKRFNNEEELISSLTERIKNLNPDIVSTYNTRYDLIRLRESQTGFEIGDKDSNPIYEATLKFFERIGIKDRLVIDFMRWQKIARPYEINAKLETAAGFEKSISYKKIAELEKKSLLGDTKAAEVIAKYLSIDVDAIYKIYQNKEFRINLEDALWVCKRYNIGIERIMHSLNSFNNFQEYLYFKNLGIFRENVPPNLRTKKMQAKKGRAKEVYKKNLHNLIKQEEKKGFSKHVYKAAIPTPIFLQEAMMRRFPEIKDLYDYSEKHRNDKKRYFFLNQVLLAACDFLVTDYGFSMIEHKKLERIKKQKKDLKKIKKQENKVKKVDARIFGNYEISINNIENLIRRDINKINGFLEKNKLKVVAKEGYYVYLTGNKKALKKEDAPLILVDEIERLYNADNVYYKKFGFISNLKNKDNGDYHLCKLEMKMFNEVIENLLFEKKTEAKNLLKNCFDMIKEKKVPKHELLYYNKNKKRYFAYTTDSNLKTGKTHFVLDDKINKELKIFFDEERNMRYYIGSERKNDVQIYIIENFEDLNIDYSKYEKRLKKKGDLIFNKT